MHKHIPIKEGIVCRKFLLAIKIGDLKEGERKFLQLISGHQNDRRKLLIRKQV
jgi:hypothetical protein